MSNKKGVEREFVIWTFLALALLLLILIAFFPPVRERFAYYVSIIGDLV